MAKKGGKRSGAGRPKGSPNKNQALLRDYAQRIAHEEGLDSPLDTMLGAMRYFNDAALEHERNKSALMDGSGDTAKAYGPIQLRLLALDAAARAAPYTNPKLASIQATLSTQVSMYESALLELAKSTEGLDSENTLHDGPTDPYKAR